MQRQSFAAELLTKDPHYMEDVILLDPVASVQCFHCTVSLTFAQLLGTVPFVTSRAPKKRHLDGVAADVVPGIYGHISGATAVAEPQLRKALHLHALLQAVGYDDPAQLFDTDDFERMFARVWRFNASSYFCAPEAFALFCGTRAAETAMSETPAVAFTAKQANIRL